MAWNPNIPNANDKLSISQAQIKANFQALDPLFNQGELEFITLPVQPSTPTYGAGDQGIYNLTYNNGTTTLNELFFHKQTSSGTAEIPVTASILSQDATRAANTAGWTYLPSGILLRWEQANANGLTTVTLSPGYPAFNAIFSIQLTPVNSSTGDIDFAVRLVDILSTTQFRVYGSSRTTTGAATGSYKILIIGR